MNLTVAIFIVQHSGKVNLQLPTQFLYYLFMYTMHALPGNYMCSAELRADKFKLLCKTLIVAHHLPPRIETSHEELQAEDTSVGRGTRTSHISVQVTKVTV